MLRTIVATLLAAVSLACGATKLERAALNQLFSASDVVAVVQIVQGRTLHKGMRDCGARYEGRVIDAIKGVAIGDSIEFGRIEGYGVGTHYIVFLSPKERPFNPLLSTNSIDARGRAELNQACFDLWPKLSLIHSGTSAFRILWYDDDSKSSRAVFIRPDVVAVPPSGYAKTSGSHGYPTYDGSLYIPLDDVMGYLRKLVQ